MDTSASTLKHCRDAARSEDQGDKEGHGQRHRSNEKKRKRHRHRSSSSSSSCSSTEMREKRHKSAKKTSHSRHHKAKRKAKKSHKRAKSDKASKKKKSEETVAEKQPESDGEMIGPSPAKMCTTIMKPMTKEDWEKKQSVMRHVYDAETGRQRLIRGDGEVMEEIVSYKHHQAVNKKATQSDGDSFQAHLGLNK